VPLELLVLFPELVLIPEFVFVPEVPPEPPPAPFAPVPCVDVEWLLPHPAAVAPPAAKAITAEKTSRRE
jgi:hypothetical protein